MERAINVKNILILLAFFFLGYLCNIVVLNWQDINIYQYLSVFKDERVIEEVFPISQVGVTTDCKKEEEVVDSCPLLVDISGAVKTPGVYCFPKDSTVVDAVKKAQGFTKDAGFKYISMKINLATNILDNSKIYIPFENDLKCDSLSFSLPKEIVDITVPTNDPGGTEAPPNICISINSAPQEELESLNGVGPSTAAKIIEGRPYSQLEDLLNVSGIGETTLNKFISDICL